MNNFRYFLLLAVTGFGAWSSPAYSREGGYEQAAPQQQRRSELRLALMAPRPRDAQSHEGVRDDGVAARQMSDQDRANLRQQLRQQRRDGRPERP